MALPVVIAKNQTASPIFLPRLGYTVPASPATLTLTDFASFYEISWEAQLQTSVGSGDIVINDGTSDLSAAEATGYLDATGNMNGPVTGATNNALIRLSGTTGRYTKATGITIDDSNNINVGAGDITTTGNINASGGGFTFPTALAPTPTTEGQVFWDTDDDVLRVGNGATTVTIPKTTDITLQLAYNNGPSITTAASTDILFTLTSGGFTVGGSGTIAIGNGATTQTVGVGTGAGAKTVTVGSTNTTSSITIDAGTGTISIGASASARTVNLATGAANQTVTLGSTSGTSSMAIDAGTGAINIGSSASARTINLGVAAGVIQTISVGGTGANVIVVGNTQTGGSVSVGAAMTTGTISIGGTGAQTGTISLGTGTGAQTISLATGGTGTKTVTVGSTASVSTLTLQAGTGPMTFTAGDGWDVNAVGAVTIDSSGSTIGIGTDANTGAISVGTGAAARTITVGNTTGATAVNLTAGTGNVNTTSAMAWTGIISPTALTGVTTNDYSPTGLSGASTIRQDVTTANTTLTGLAGGATGRVLVLENVSSTFNLILSSQNAGSTAANRFAFSADITLNPSDSVTLDYDATSSRWRAIGIARASTGAPAGSLQGAYNGGATITTASATDIAFTLTSGGFTVNGTGTVNMGADATAQTLNFGTGAAAKTVSVGSTNTTSTTTITAGTGHTSVTTGFVLNGVISPTALTTNTNDYNPTGFTTASSIRLSSTTNVNVTGLTGGTSGRVVIITNVGSNLITLTDEDANSTAANRFALPNNVRLGDEDSVILQYDSTSARWRAPGTSAGTTGSQIKSRFYQFAANASTAKGDHNTVSVAANGSLRLESQIPEDFVTLVSFQAIMIPGATNATANIDLASDYAAVGEVFNVNSEADTTSTFALTIDQITGISLATVATNIAAGDFFGVTITHNAIGATAFYLGTLFRYYA